MRKLLLILCLLGCGPAHHPAQPEPFTDYVWTSNGQAVSFGASLHEHPALRDLAISQIEAALVRHPDPQAAFTVQAYPLVIDPMSDPFGHGTLTTCTSWVELETHVIHLSWEQDTYTKGVFTVADPSYEIKNDLCHCESGLR